MKLNLSIFGFVLLTGVVFFSVGCISNGISNATPSLALATTIPAATHSSATRSVETAVPATPIAITATATNIAIPATVTVAVASPTLTPESTAVPVEPAGTPSLFFLAPDGHIYGTDEVGSFRQQLTIMPEPLDENSEVWRSFYYYRPPQLSPDGQWLILNDGRGGWSLLELSPQRIHSQGKGDPLLSPSWAPDSQRFVYVGQNNQLCIFELAEQTTSCPFQGASKLIGALWSPSGMEVAVAVSSPECCVGDVWLITISDGSAELISTHSTALEAKGDEIIAWASNPPTLLIKAQAADGSAALYSPQNGMLQALSDLVRDVSENGRFLLYNSGEIGESDGSILYTPSNLCESGQLNLLQHWDWSPTGDQLAYLTQCQSDGDQPTMLSVVDLISSSLLWQLEVTQPLQLIYWSPDGNYLFLDQVDILPEDSPIWRIMASGREPLQTVVAEGFLLGTLP